MSNHDGRPAHALVLISLMIAATYVPAFRVWPWLWVIPLAGYAALTAIVRPLRNTFAPLHLGRVSPIALTGFLVITLASCSVLSAFQLLVRPQLESYRQVLPVSALGGLWMAGVLFSIFNALFEEIIFRGVFFDSVCTSWGTGAAVGVTSILFGLAHMRGYPPGPLGMVLATIYGLCLSWLRLATAGLSLPVLAHIAADATIFTILATHGGL